MSHLPLSWKQRAATVGLLFSLPFSALAATPQQTLDAGFKRLGDSGALRIESTFDFDIMERPYDRKQPPTTGKVQVKMSQRVLPLELPSLLQNNEARLSLNGSFSGLENDLPGFSGTLTEPITLEWKMVGDVAYFRIEHVPQELIDGIKMLEVDPSLLIGQWIRVEGLSKEMLNSFSGELGADPFKILKKNSSSLQRLVQFLRIEKRETRGDGHVILRTRLRIHPSFITELHREALTSIDPKAPYRERVNERNIINQRFVQLRRILNGMQIVAVIDETAQTIERVEIGGKISEPQKTCTWNVLLRRSVCKDTSLLTIRYAVGMSFLKDSGQAIEVPYGSLTFEELIERFMPKPVIEDTATSTEFDPFGPHTSSTLTAP